MNVIERKTAKEMETVGCMSTNRYSKLKIYKSKNHQLFFSKVEVRTTVYSGFELDFIGIGSSGSLIECARTILHRVRHTSGTHSLVVAPLTGDPSSMMAWVRI